MKIAPTKVGAQPKQLIILGGLVVVAIVTYLINRSPSSPDVPTPAPRTEPVASAIQPITPVTRKAPSMPMPGQQSRPTRGESRSTEDFRPTLKLKEGTDVSRMDPTLRLELLAKLRATTMEGGSRSIFEFAQPPAPPPPKVDPIKMVKAPPAVAAAKPAVALGADGKPLPPPPPPIPLKFYGYANSPKNGPKRAFFLDGDDIFVAAENDMIRNRYKIVRIGVNSAVVEDTTTNHQQTLALIEELPS